LRGSDACGGWKVASTVPSPRSPVGIGGAIEPSKIASPMVGFIFDGKGLRYHLTLVGSNITRIGR